MKPKMNYYIEADGSNGLYYAFKFVAYEKSRKLWLGLKVDADEDVIVITDIPNEFVNAFWFDETGICDLGDIVFTLNGEMWKHERWS